MPEVQMKSNEAFHTNYPENVPCKELKNEHYTKNGKVVTDALFEIQSHLYHIECQSGKGGRCYGRQSSKITVRDT